MNTPTINVTDAAKLRIAQVRENRKEPEAGVRIAITGRESGDFVYDIALVAPGHEHDGDVVVAGPDGITFHVPLTSVASLDNITVNADPLRGAITIENPNPLWSDALALRVQEFLDAVINPMVAQHGGKIDLLDVADGVAYVHMGGGCQGCGMAAVTLSQGVREELLGNFPEISEVRDDTDHAQGKNPYYQAAKK